MNNHSDCLDRLAADVTSLVRGALDNGLSSAEILQVSFAALAGLAASIYESREAVLARCENPVQIALADLSLDLRALYDLVEGALAN